VSKVALTIKNYTTAQLEAALQTDEKFRQAIRIFACLQVSKGRRPVELEDLYNTTFKSICNWINRLNDGGIDALYDKPKSGRPKGLKSEHLNRVKDVALNYSPEEFGYNSSTWTGPLLAAWIESEFGVSYKKAQIYNIMHALSLSFQKGKGFYPEAKDREVILENVKKNSKKSVKQEA
jgi:transposase